MDRARHLWEQLAAAPVSFPSKGGRQIVASPDSNLCPPSWTGIVELGGAAIITAPDEVQARHLRKLLAAAAVDSLVWAPSLDDLLPVADVLGPAALAYVPLHAGADAVWPSK